MITEAENIIQDIQTLPIKPLQRVYFREGAGAILQALLVLLMIAIAPILISFVVLKALGIFGSHGLGQSLAYLYFISWFAGVATAKSARYLYWRSKP